jgi:hypothetical protein
MTRSSGLSFGTALLAVLALCARDVAAQETVEQFWPEVEVFYKTGAHTRVYGLANRTFSSDNLQDDQQYGLNLDVFIKRVLHPVVDTRELDRGQPLMLRVGYRYDVDYNVPEPPVTNRILIELAVRWTFKRVTLADRSGIDFRWTDGKYSSRYRNRLRLEVPLTLGQYKPAPYASAEWYYAIQAGEWTKVKYEVGAHLPIARHVATEPYAGWEIHWDRARNVRALGLRLILSW